MSETVDTPAEIALIPRAAVSTIIAADKDDLLGSLARKLAEFKGDPSTERGRKEIRSMAYSVARTKGDLLRVADQAAESAKKIVDGIRSEKKLLSDRLDELKAEVARPADEFEAEIERRAQAHRDAIAAFQESPSYFAAMQPSADVRKRLEWLENMPPRDWGEFRFRATEDLRVEIEKTRELLARCLKHEEEQAELARLRAEAAERRRQEQERERAEREARIAAEAAARARQEAEEAAQREREAMERAAEEERRRVAAETARAEAARAMAEARAKQEAAEAQARVEAARREAEERADRAERERIQAIEDARLAREAAEDRAAADAKAAAEKAERDRVAAVEAERQRVAAAAAKAKADAEARERNIAHRRKVNGAAVKALVLTMSDIHTGNADEAEKLARAIVEAIARGNVPAVSIAY